MNDLEPVDWAQVARAALANGASKGMRKVNRRTLTDLCERLASGIPLETAARLQSIRPETIREWSDTRPVAWRAIERARAAGENLCIQKIANASDWKAADRLLTLQRPEYREGGAQGGSNGPQINVVINVPVPRLVEPGTRPIVEIAAVHPQDVVPELVQVGHSPAK